MDVAFVSSAIVALTLLALTKYYPSAWNTPQLWRKLTGRLTHLLLLISGDCGIKSVKSHLIRIIGEQILTYEEFYTVLVQVEAILNSRPLCQLSSDPNDLSVLTPGHFLSLEPLTAIPDPDLTHLNLNHLKRWQLLQRFHQDFWKRWHNEYLHTLQQRNKWNNPEKIIEPGTLVLIKNDLLPPLQWRIGRIEKIHPGSDGISRVATLKTTQGSLQRPLIKLCPLPSQ